MTKPILLFVALISVLSISAQKGILHQFEIKGAYLYDQDDHRASFIEEKFGDTYILDYQGLNYIALAYTQINDKNISGIEIDYFKYGKL